MFCIIMQINFDDAIKSWPIVPLEVSVSWSGTEGEQIMKIEHELLLVCGKKQFKIMIASPERCTGNLYIQLLECLYMYMCACMLQLQSKTRIGLHESYVHNS